MNKKLSRQNWKSRRVRESITSERPHGAEPDGAFNNYLPPPHDSKYLPKPSEEEKIQLLSWALRLCAQRVGQPVYKVFLQIKFSKIKSADCRSGFLCRLGWKQVASLIDTRIIL
jgi:hypothetical protein